MKKYNCPNCHKGNLEIWNVDTVTFLEPEDEYTMPIKMNLTGTAKCNNCNVEYKMDAKDVSYGAYQWKD